MTRRRLLLLFAVVLASLLGVGVYLLVPPKPGVTLENFRRLHKDMSEDEVDVILGPASDDSMFPQINLPDEIKSGLSDKHHLAHWRGDRVQIWVVFWNDQLRLATYQETHPLDDNSIGEMIRRWVKNWTGWQRPFRFL